MNLKRLKLNIRILIEESTRKSNTLFTMMCGIAYILGRYGTIEKLKLERYAKTLTLLEKDINPNEYKICSINEGTFNYFTLHTGFIDEVLGTIVYCLNKEHLPSINVLDITKSYNLWSRFFQQPFDVNEETNSKKSYIKCEKINPTLAPSCWGIYDNSELDLWCALYKRFLILNDETQTYINQEYDSIIPKGKRVLGVLCRGTDYTETRPANHPIQPSIDTVINHAKEKMRDLNIEYIYLATEEKRIVDKFEAAFPNHILLNKRRYLDDLYYNLKNTTDDRVELSHVQLEREDDGHYRGLEYLSSLIILSRCDALVGGNCGGSRTALYMNNMKYEYWHLFDLGLYGIDD